MGKTQSGIMEPCTQGCENPKDSRYTQYPNYDSDYARSKDRLAEDKIRKPKLSEGLAFREKI